MRNVSVILRLRPDLLSRIQANAEAVGMSRNQLIAYILTNATTAQHTDASHPGATA
jgi:predicted DNA binding CopG/RHH family protein